jgi:glycosyltransferase involved in cell wall biosynthesis
MNTIAYLANSFPEAGESYVWEEIRELRRRGREILCCSFRRSDHVPPELSDLENETIYIQHARAWIILAGLAVVATKFHPIRDLVWRALRGPETFQKRLRAFGHTWLGVCLAASLRRKHISHIHVHHGYFASWAGMVAARLLDASFSVTLHGSDLLLRADYLDCKLQECRFCVTVSEFNRNHIAEQYPEADLSKLVVHRLGVDVDFWRPRLRQTPESHFSILSVGRLHSIKNHEFLVRACCALKNAGVNLHCVIAGEGEEHEKLRRLIDELALANEIELHGHVPAEQLPEFYSRADVVVLTSRSEGIPLALMEAMAMECVVLAPAITGIPELIEHGKTGWLYQPGSMDDLLAKLLQIKSRPAALSRIRSAARRQIESRFSRETNLARFADDFLKRIDSGTCSYKTIYEDSLLQQI